MSFEKAEVPPYGSFTSAGLWGFLRSGGRELEDSLSLQCRFLCCTNHQGFVSCTCIPFANKNRAVQAQMQKRGKVAQAATAGPGWPGQAQQWHPGAPGQVWEPQGPRSPGSSQPESQLVAWRPVPGSGAFTPRALFADRDILSSSLSHTLWADRGPHP